MAKGLSYLSSDQRRIVAAIVGAAINGDLLPRHTRNLDEKDLACLLELCSEPKIERNMKNLNNAVDAIGYRVVKKSWDFVCG